MAEEKSKMLPTKKNDVYSLLNTETIRQRFEEMLGKKAPGFISSIISAVNMNRELKKADPMSIISAAAIAASLDLPINPSLGFTCIVPYSGMAQFQMQWKGFVQLALRSGQYKTINVSPVCEGELTRQNKFTGEMEFDEKARTSPRVIGYVAYFKLLNGFEKYFYMTVAEAKGHGIRYSKAYNRSGGAWQTQPEMMSMKTVVKLLLSKWGILSIEMQKAIEADQAIIKGTGEYECLDNPESSKFEDESRTTQSPNGSGLSDFQELVKVKAKEGKDISYVQDFIKAVAIGNKTTEDNVKVEATKDWDSFWKMYERWVEERKEEGQAQEKQPEAPKGKRGRPPGSKNKQEKETPAQTGPGRVVCPDQGNNLISTESCEKCEKRPGCPAWD